MPGGGTFEKPFSDEKKAGEFAARERENGCSDVEIFDLVEPETDGG
jgi:hypothetical protein